MEGLATGSTDIQPFSRARIAPALRYSAGVDPGKQTGIGIFDRERGALIHFMTTDFFGVADRLRRLVRVAELMVYVEIPVIAFYRGTSDAKIDAESVKQRDRFMSNCGGVRREAQLLAESLRREGFNVVEVRPVAQKKWTEEQFQQATKIYQRTNAHERDACRLAMVHANDRKLVPA